MPEYTWQFEASYGIWRNYSAPDGSALDLSHQYYREHGLRRGKRLLTKLNQRICIVNFQKMRQTDVLKCRRYKMRLVSVVLEAQRAKVPGLNLDLNSKDTGGISFSTASTREPASLHTINSEGSGCCAKGAQSDSSALTKSIDFTPAQLPEVRYIDPAVNLSTISNNGSVFWEEGGPPQPALLERSSTAKCIFSNAIAEFKQHMDNERTSVHIVQQVIDNLWLTEFNAQVRAELYYVTIESAKMIERGMNSMEVRREAYTRFAVAGEDALKGLEARASNRDAVAIDGGFEYLERVVRENFAASLLIVRASVDQLTDTQQASRVKTELEKHFANLLQELESISIAKEVNSLTLLGLDESMQQVEMAECSFVKSVVSLAKANQQNASIQVRALRTLAKIAEVYVKDGRDTVRCGENDEDTCPNVSGFIRDTISAFGKGSPNVLTEGVLAAMWCSAYAQNGGGQVAGVIGCITALMQAQVSDSVLQNSAIAALLILVEPQSCCCEGDAVEYQKLLASNPVVQERLLDAMASHPSDAQIQEHGSKLWSILKQTPALHVDAATCVHGDPEID
jgi:hypothetical protein